MTRWIRPAIVLSLLILAVTAGLWAPSLLVSLGVEAEPAQRLSGLTVPLLCLGAALATLALTVWRERRPGREPSRQIGTSGGAYVERDVVADTFVGHDLAAGKVEVGRDVYGDVILVADPKDLWRLLSGRRPSDSLLKATECYLQYLVDRYRYLDFKGMGIYDRIPLRLSLADMYVPLKASAELPEGDTWDRELLLSGHAIPDMRSEAISLGMGGPRPLLELLRQNDGLIILGDPGAGKTTFLKYLTLKLALGEGERLELGTRLPVLIPLSAYAGELAGRDVRLDDFIAEYFHDLGTDLPIAAMLKETLERGGALVLLDGLDEVKDLVLRHTVIQRVMDFYNFHRRAGNKFALTSRIVGYREVRPIAEGLTECTLVDFEDWEIETFVSQWTAAVERVARGDTPSAAREAERECQELLEAIRRNPGLRRLATNPLLLTILALMKRQGGILPERRVELYTRYVETLLSSWNRVRGLGRPQVSSLDVVETVRILAQLALWMHRTSPGVGLVERGELERKLVAIYEERSGVEEPERIMRQFLEDVRLYSGLLLERGAGQYGFIHLTFEEYLAAVGIARLGQRDIEPVVNVLAEHVGDPAWHEAILLTIGYLGVIQQWEEMASDVVLALLSRRPGRPGQAAVLAGGAVVDTWPGGVTPACKAEVVRALVETTRDEKVKATTRADAGDTLARLGDPRPEIAPSEPGELERMEFCYVPPGPFWVGSEEGSRYEKPLQLDGGLDYGYWLARYQVTVAQLRLFAQDSGYKLGYEQILRWSANHPAVMLTWYDALVFCDWLAEQWRDLLPQGHVVTMPSEVEWEKAARGGLEIPRLPIITALADKGRPLLREDPLLFLRTNLRPQRRYPWGDWPDPNLANYDDTGIGSPSAVGTFPGGASPYGCQDMAGNVWEWTRSNWEEEAEPGHAANKQENRKTRIARVVRGGSFYESARNVRCSVRDRGIPDLRVRLIGFRVAVVPADFDLPTR